MSALKIKALICATACLAILTVCACKSTPAPRAPLPPQPAARPPQDSGAPSAPTATRGQPGSQAGSPQPPEQAQQPATQQAGVPSASASASRAAPVGKQTSRRADAKLAKAREDLRIGQATEKRIAADLAKLKQSDQGSAQEIRDHEAYLERVQAMVAENRKTVQNLERAYARRSTTGKAAPARSPYPAGPPIPEEQVQDPVAALDRQLNASLSEFDALLLNEMETIEAESAAKMRDLAQAAADAAGRLNAGEEVRNTAESETSATTSPGDRPGAPNDTPPKKDDGTTATPSKGTGPDGKGDRASRYDKNDDDIVARQLREAAEKETDPVLKEKLWREYEAYKRNTQK